MCLPKFWSRSYVILAMANVVAVGDCCAPSPFGAGQLPASSHLYIPTQCLTQLADECCDRAYSRKVAHLQRFRFLYNHGLESSHITTPYSATAREARILRYPHPSSMASFTSPAPYLQALRMRHAVTGTIGATWSAVCLELSDKVRPHEKTLDG